VHAVTVTVDQQARTAALAIYWEGGASSSITVTLPRLGTPWRTTDTSTVDLVRRLAEHHDDATIAGVLARQGRREREDVGHDDVRPRLGDQRPRFGGRAHGRFVGLERPRTGGEDLVLRRRREPHARRLDVLGPPRPRLQHDLVATGDERTP